jgi:hypothetical protein
VRADVEIGQRRGARARATAVFQKGLAGEKARFPRQWQVREGVCRQGIVQVFDALETNRYLGVDDRVDAQFAFGSADVQLRGRPCEPMCVFGEVVTTATN